MATPNKLPPLPAILIANDLLDGDVVFAAGNGWTLNPAEATIARDEETARALEALGAAAFRANRVVDAYLVDITEDEAGVPTPRHFRERFRTKGPSNRPDLGKQADFDRTVTRHG
ncbi:MAG: DUF2849 domain-containing protein [Proteobacteria bacterium]|nr:DUF2849 domain-containing protein [Pseudomonadota bacterium]